VLQATSHSHAVHSCDSEQKDKSAASDVTATLAVEHIALVTVTHPIHAHSSVHADQAA